MKTIRAQLAHSAVDSVRKVANSTETASRAACSICEAACRTRYARRALRSCILPDKTYLTGRAT
eukprot:767620-Hanusia_phi.AAC.10